VRTFDQAEDVLAEEGDLARGRELAQVVRHLLEGTQRL
tara:strand:- start:11 stop:124 length:114 start_codon:yes stop_codon:yes gene_type:complete